MVLTLLLSLLLSTLIVACYFLFRFRKRSREYEQEVFTHKNDVQELQKKLRIKEFQLIEAQRTGEVGSFVLNLSDNVVVFSEELYHLCGLEQKSDKLSFTDFLALILPEDKPTVEAKLHEAAQNVEPFDLTFRVRHPDATTHWLKAHVRTMHSDSGMSLQVLGTVRDVTDLEEREENLQAKTAELTQKVKELEQARTTMSTFLRELNAERAKDGAILSSIGEGVIATDKEGKIIFINPIAETMLGVRLIDVMGKAFDEVVIMMDEKGNKIPLTDRPIQQTLHTGKVVSDSRYLYEKTDKSRFPVFTTASPIFLNGQTIGAIDVFRDITREKDIDRMKTEFISLASHQLRTPLAAMKWFLEILLGGDVGTLTDEQRDAVSNVNESNERMIALVNSLLNVSRIESGRIIIDPEPTDLRMLIDGVLVEVKPRLDEKKQHFSINAPNDLPSIMLDPKLIRQVYMNLLTNAIKYTPPEGNISISLQVTDTEIISAVSDTGYGIPAKDKDKVFSKFYRGENIVSLETDGNGLGLYLVKTIVESSKGKIWFETFAREGGKEQDKQGTTFWFSLPLSGVEAKKGEVVLA